MNANPCEREAAILAAARAGTLGAAEREHLRGCESCEAALAIEAAFATLAASPDLGRAAARLPSAHQVLLRARLEARRAEAERSLRPLLLWQRFAAGVAAAAVAVGLALGAPVLAGIAQAPRIDSASPARLLFAVGVLAIVALPFALRRRGAA
jgi:hypothetical protein